MSDQKRIETDIETLRHISEPCAYGTQRRSYTPEFRQGVDYIKNRMEEFGLETREDQIGNLFGILPGTDPSLPHILSGSHMDSVKCSGAFDGLAGVICALEAARMIKESGHPLRHTYEVMGTVGEEGVRFGQALIGSRYMCGIIGEKELDEYVGRDDGLTLREAMKGYGLSGDISKVSRVGEKLKATIELHAEQGPIMENEGVSIGVVDNIVAISWMEVKTVGLAQHPGTIPMSVRKDAGVAAFRLILDVRDYVEKKYDGHATVTTGRLNLMPGSSNCIPSECVFTIDIRAESEEYRDDIRNYIISRAPEVAKTTHCEITVKEGNSQAPLELNGHIRDLIEQAAEERGYSHTRINSGAGHDSMAFAELWPAAMIFLQSHDGLTHHPDELIPYPEMAKGANVLYDVIRKLDGEPD